MLRVCLAFIHVRKNSYLCVNLVGQKRDRVLLFRKERGRLKAIPSY